MDSTSTEPRVTEKKGNVTVSLILVPGGPTLESVNVEVESSYVEVEFRYVEICQLR